MKKRWQVLTVAAAAGAVLLLLPHLSSDRTPRSPNNRSGIRLTRPKALDRHASQHSSWEGKSLDVTASEGRLPPVEHSLPRKLHSTAAVGRPGSEERLLSQWKKSRLTQMNQLALAHKKPDTPSTNPLDRTRPINIQRNTDNMANVRELDGSRPSKVRTDKQKDQQVSSVISTNELLDRRLTDIQTNKAQPIPHMGDYNCSDRLCLKFIVTDIDKRAVQGCLGRKFPYQDVNSWPGKCHFMNGTFRAPVALASPPSSGNTWVRGLLEQATGICTGAIYCDSRLVKGGFNGEHVRSGTVLAVKLHSPSTLGKNFDLPVSSSVHPLNQILQWYGSAIVIIRNPFDCLVSDWNRIRGGGNHTSASIDASNFGYNVIWNKYVKQRINSWASFVLSWASVGTQIPVLLIRYEDVKTDAVKEVKRMLDFLGVPYSDEELKQKLSQDFTAFQRQHKHDEFDHYTNEQRQLLLSVVQETVSKIHEISTTFPTQELEEYLN